MIRTRFIWIILVAISVSFSGSVMSQENLPALDDLQPGWNVITAGGETTCAMETPYHFFVRPGTNNRLLIHLQGGGFCWADGTCGAKMGQSSLIDSSVDMSEINDYTAGIFDLENPANPFRDDSMVFVAYCTGDGHLGNTIVPYGEGVDALTIHHTGYTNATTVLDWTAANFPEPESVFVTGCSAGAVATPFYADAIATHYQDVPVVALADAAGSYGTVSLLIPLLKWGTISILPDAPEFEGIAEKDLTFDDLYAAAAAHHPHARFAQVNTAKDATQSFYLRLFGDSTPIQNRLASNMALLAERAPNFNYYTAWGNAHCLTPVPDFYTYQVNGVSLRDWVADLVTGEAVDNIHCTDCDASEFVSSVS